MDWPHYKPSVTVIDVLDSGACIEGVMEWVDENDVIACSVGEFSSDHITVSSRADGDGSGYGSGDG